MLTERAEQAWITVSEPRLILTCGLPGAGKTTLAHQLAADRSAVRLTKDEWLWALGASPWDATTNDKVERDDLRTTARSLGIGVELHYLDAPIDELWRRIQLRNTAPPWDSEPILLAHLVEWASTFQEPDAAGLALFDAPPDPN